MDAFYLCGGALNVKTCPVGPSQCAKIVIILFCTLHAYIEKKGDTRPGPQQKRLINQVITVVLRPSNLN